MEYAIVHRISGNIVEKHIANSDEECREQILKYHPELECDTVNEMLQKYPVYFANLWLVKLN